VDQELGSRSIHFPRWLTRDGANLFPEKGAAMAEIFILSLLLGFRFKRTNSLWGCFLLHAANNLAAVII